MLKHPSLFILLYWSVQGLLLFINSIARYRNKHSQGVVVAVDAKFFLTNLGRTGYLSLCNFHHCNGSIFFLIYWLSLYRSTIVFVDEERDQWLVFRVWQQFMLSHFLLGDSSVVCSTLSYWAEFLSRNCSSCQTSSLLSFRKHILNAGPEQSQFWTTMCLLKFSLYCSRSAINAFLDKRCWQDRYHALSFLILDGKGLVEASCFPAQ